MDKKVTFNNKISVFKIPDYDRYNWNLIDSIRKRDIIIQKWHDIVDKLINKN
tara:strand:- start:465 stop:620 length:156 start_codon:yes stop_codon:yes gene_type:complete